MDKFAGLTGRQYHLLITMATGSRAGDRHGLRRGDGFETAKFLNQRGERWGHRRTPVPPLLGRTFCPGAPASVKTSPCSTAQEPGATGEPLIDVVTAIREAMDVAWLLRASPAVIGGRYGLSSGNSPRHGQRRF
jgi:hypothetical protein